MITAWFVKVYNSIISFYMAVKNWFKKMFVKSA